MIARWSRDERGGAMVEFALVVPLLLVLLMGIIEFGRVWNTEHVMTDAAREGARRAVVRLENQALKKGTGSTMGIVPGAVIQRLTDAGIEPQDVAWDPTSAAHYADDCDTWTRPTGTVSQTSIYGCGWGDSTGEEAIVVILSPYPFNFFGPILGLLGGNVQSTQLSTYAVMRNE